MAQNVGCTSHVILAKNFNSLSLKLRCHTQSVPLKYKLTRRVGMAMSVIDDRRGWSDDRRDNQTCHSFLPYYIIHQIIPRLGKLDGARHDTKVFVFRNCDGCTCASASACICTWLRASVRACVSFPTQSMHYHHMCTCRASREDTSLDPVHFPRWRGGLTN